MIARPARGERPKASWAAAVTDVCNSVAAVGTPGALMREGAWGRGAEPVPANRRDRRGETRPLPYEVRFHPACVPDAEDEDAPPGPGWVIYLPTAYLLWWNFTYVDIFNGTGLAGCDAMGDGWYALCGVPLTGRFGADSGYVWLQMYSTELADYVVFSPREEGVGRSWVRSLNIAELEHDATTGRGSVRQSVVGAIFLTDPCHCGDGSSESGTESSGSGPGGDNSYTRQQTL